MKNFISLILFIFTTSMVLSQDVDFKEIDQYLEKTYKEWDIPGMAVGIVQNGELIYSKGFGVKKIGEKEAPDKNTNYAIASNSKAFTTAIIAQLVQEGALDWDDKVVDYLPYFEIYDPIISRMVTIEDLLCHRVGLGTFSGDIMWYDAQLTTEEIVRRAKFIPQAFEFRDGFGYSNVMYITAGAVIEKVTGKSWCENVTERILRPLDMDSTYCELDIAKSNPNLATPHATIDGNNTIIRWENWDNVAATGGLISNVEDLSKWLIFNMGDGIVDQDTLITPQSRNKIWTAHNVFTVNHATDDILYPDFSGYGLGFNLGEYKGHFRVSHTGGFGGMLSSITMLPDEDLAVIMLSNDTESPIMAVAYYILDRFVDRESSEDYSKDMLKRMRDNQKNDTRIEDIQERKIKGTKASKRLEEYTGYYYSDLYGGNISVVNRDGKLFLEFEHSPTLDAELQHWHYDTFEVKWIETQPWFGFGVVQFTMNTNQEITGLTLNIPNNDFFFEELAPYKRKND